MDQDTINYPKLLDQAMQLIVKEALNIASKNGLPGNNHFFISFLTFHPQVTLSKKLRNRYPQEMTIVLQHQFEKLEIKDEYFSVCLSFDGIKEKIVVPYDSMTAFADPSVKFGLQFKHLLEEEELQEFILENEEYREDKPLEEVTDSSSSNVVSLESFRKKH